MSSINIVIPSDKPSDTYMGPESNPAQITGLDVWHYGHWSSSVNITGTGAKGKALRGGLHITAAMMDDLCAQWIAARKQQEEA